MVTQELLKELFDYREDGRLVRKVTTDKRCNQSGVTTALDTCGYLTTGIKGVLYGEHRLVFMWHYGKFPDGHIDHINRIKTDNRIENLRAVTHSINMLNKNLRPENKSGYAGVTQRSDSGSWRAAFMRKDLGTFKIKQRAIDARKQAEQQFWSKQA